MPLVHFRFQHIIIITLCLLTSCKDFIEPSISDKKVFPLAPASDYVSSTYDQTFWWETVDDANSYRLQIVTDSFSVPGKLIVDTPIKSNKLRFDLDPGNYEWRVRAENGSTQTAFSIPRKLTVSTSSIKLQTVQLLSPVNNSLVTQGSNLFRWQPIYGALRYHIQIDSNNFMNENDLLIDESVPVLQRISLLPKEGTYQWRVRAENDTAQSKWSSTFLITVDQTPPARSVLLTPKNGELQNSPVTLKWEKVPEANVRYKLSILKEDGLTTFNASFPIITRETSYIFNAGTIGEKIGWKVSALDPAGNEGQSSELRYFIIQ